MPSLPRHARLPINRCNLPADILGGLTFQRYPAPLFIDGVVDMNRQLFEALERMPEREARAQRFADYMVVRFRLENLEDLGFSPAAAADAQAGRSSSRVRARSSYLRCVRGWAFDADGREGAVLKAWVESRFGLLTRYHGGVLADPDSNTYRHFQEARSAGLYGTSALEAQLDLLYAYAQYELGRKYVPETHIVLYRGVNRLDAYERLTEPDKGRVVVLLNNLNSFSLSRERACEFGDYILEARVPLTKIFFYAGLFPGLLAGENEFAVLGGLYEVAIARY